MSCPFCNISSSKIIFETQDLFVIEDKNPVTKGHCLIVSKKHIWKAHELQASAWAQMEEILKRLTTKRKQKIDFEDYNLLNASWSSAQQSVPHFHIHFAPRQRNDGLDLWIG